MAHRDGFPKISARSAWRGGAGHREPCGTRTMVADAGPWGKKSAIRNRLVAAFMPKKIAGERHEGQQV